MLTMQDYATTLKSASALISTDIATIDYMRASIVCDNVPEAFVLVADNLNRRIHNNLGILLNSYLHIDKEIVARLNNVL